MEEQQEQEQVYDQSFNNTQGVMSRAYNDASALQIRLNTQTLIEDFELFLRGAKIEFTQDPVTMKTKARSVPIGRPKANDLGIQGILAFVSSIINAQSVQGNYEDERYVDYIINARIDLTSNIVNNAYNWAVDDDDIDVIVDTALNVIEPFMSRLIDNLERDSYAQTIRHNEVNTLQNKTSSLPFGLNFGGNK